MSRCDANKNTTYISPSTPEQPLSTTLIFQQYKLYLKHIASHIWTSIIFMENILGHWEITWENELFSLRWGLGDLWRETLPARDEPKVRTYCRVEHERERHPPGNIKSSSASSVPASVEHQHCTSTTATTAHERAQNKTPKIFNISQHTKRMLSHTKCANVSPYGHKTTPDEGTILFTLPLPDGSHDQSWAVTAARCPVNQNKCIRYNRSLQWKDADTPLTC